MTDNLRTTQNLSDIYQRYLGRYGADHPMTRRALSDARHAGVILDGILDGPLPETETYAYRGVAGEAVGNRTVVRDDMMTTRGKIRAAAALALTVVVSLISL